MATDARADIGNGPLVSVGIPVFNGADYLAEAIESLLGQTYGDFELLNAPKASDETDNATGSAIPKITFLTMIDSPN